MFDRILITSLWTISVRYFKSNYQKLTIQVPLLSSNVLQIFFFFSITIIRRGFSWTLPNKLFDFLEETSKTKREVNEFQLFDSIIKSLLLLISK